MTSPDSRSPAYQKIQLDPLPKLVQLEKKNHQELLQAYLLEHDKLLQPVKYRKGDAVQTETLCPVCGAPNDFLYDNNGQHGQFLCKVCKAIFTDYRLDFEVRFLCPFCRHYLVNIKSRKHFKIWKCVNDK